MRLLNNNSKDDHGESHDRNVLNNPEGDGGSAVVTVGATDGEAKPEAPLLGEGHRHITVSIFGQPVDIPHERIPVIDKAAYMTEVSARCLFLLACVACWSFTWMGTAWSAQGVLTAISDDDSVSDNSYDDDRVMTLWSKPIYAAAFMVAVFCVPFCMGAVCRCVTDGGRVDPIFPHNADPSGAWWRR